MRNLVKSLLFVGLLALPALSHAWTFVGNAGNVVICGNRVVGFYDRFELDLRYGWQWELAPLDLPNKSQIPDEVILALTYLKRIEKLHPFLYATLSAHVNSFYEEANFVKGYLPNVLDDAGVVVLPSKNCSLELLVVQKPVSYPKKSLYTINSFYWKALNSQDRAAAILHEVIYRVALTRGKAPRSSEGIRLLNGMILANEVKNMTEAEFAELTRLIFTIKSSDQK
ncbi:hypothetical protein ACLVWU_11050 [Bdellovibrio sp. HCB290]|uniref:hypothetical protein n=1 Tax=Bdellovibrio sp. HCB290 TaxID=3394356 RepID=UPI0039B429AA